MKELDRNIGELLSHVRVVGEEPEATPYLAYLIALLVQMKGHMELPREERSRMGGGLFRIISEDWAFTGSPLGRKILDLSRRFVDVRKG